MGHDISIIHNHNLDISNVEALAHDLAARLNINIEYGYYATSLNEKLAKKLGHNYCKCGNMLGEINKGPAFPDFELVDTNYFTKIALKRYGNDFFCSQIFHEEFSETINEEQLEEQMRQSVSIDYVLGNYDLKGYTSLFISQYFLFNGLQNNFFSWKQLCEFLLKNIRENSLNNDEDFRKLRRELLISASKLGADFVYYVDDQSDVLEGLGEGGGAEMSWEEIQTFVKEKCGDLLLDIPEYCLNEAYRKLWVDRQQQPLAFVDDFRDLKSF